jgi:hypothetical protein
LTGSGPAADARTESVGFLCPQLRQANQCPFGGSRLGAARDGCVAAGALARAKNYGCALGAGGGAGRGGDLAEQSFVFGLGAGHCPLGFNRHQRPRAAGHLPVPGAVQHSCPAGFTTLAAHGVLCVGCRCGRGLTHCAGRAQYQRGVVRVGLGVAGELWCGGRLARPLAAFESGTFVAAAAVIGVQLWCGQLPAKPRPGGAIFVGRVLACKPVPAASWVAVAANKQSKWGASCPLMGDGGWRSERG